MKKKSELKLGLTFYYLSIMNDAMLWYVYLLHTWNDTILNIDKNFSCLLGLHNTMCTKGMIINMIKVFMFI